MTNSQINDNSFKSETNIVLNNKIIKDLFQDDKKSYFLRLDCQLGIIDNKSAGLLTFNTLIVMILIFVIDKNKIFENGLYYLPIISSVLLVISSLCCFLNLNLIWKEFDQKLSTGEIFNEIMDLVKKRTTHFTRAFWATGIAVTILIIYIYLKFFLDI